VSNGEFHGERRFAANRGQSKRRKRDFQMLGYKSLYLMSLLDLLLSGPHSR